LALQKSTLFLFADWSMPDMPNKHNDARRHHIPKMKFKVTNWSNYEAGLRRRGSLTLWVSDEAIAAWTAAPRTTPGGQARYSETAIETALMVRLVFHGRGQKPRHSFTCN
jgi:hypothetical protein